MSNMKERRIHKYTLAVMDEQTLLLPRGARIMTIQVQAGQPQLWAYVDPTKPKEARKIRVIGTGRMIDDDPGDYLGTFQMHAGALVFHVFEAR